MSRRMESIRMQRARRRRRRLIAKMILVLVLITVILAACITFISKMLQKPTENRDIVADSELHADISAKSGLYADSAGGSGEGSESKEAPSLKDQEPPEIHGVKELTVPLGGSVSYKRDVTVTDNQEGEVTLTVDTSQVDLETEGTYPVTYIATDAAGNVTEVSTLVHVENVSSGDEAEELVNAKADEVLAEITTENMTEYEKAEAIFFWVHDNVSWTDYSPKEDWVQGAYQGLVERKGDCYVYAMTSKCLLTRAGIENMDIEKIPTSTEHYWNLIDLGDGWYHFDTTRRKDKTYFFYTTDEELMEYSRSHRNSHNYDPTQYPEIQ